MSPAQRVRSERNEFVMHDIRVPPGDYLIEVTAPASTAQPYVVRSVEVTDPIADAEPNDGRDRAIAIDPSSLTTLGRLAAANDRDDWSFTVDPAMAQRQVGIELTTAGTGALNVCLFGPAGPPIKCRDGNGGLALSNLVLPEGAYVLEVAGAVDLESGYHLAILDGGLPAEDREVEPNDRADTPTVWDPGLVMHGTLETADDDLYRVTVDGPAELWSVDATGAGLESIQWIGVDGGALGVARAAADGSSASLKDLYLLPGDHLVRVRGRNGGLRPHAHLPGRSGPRCGARAERRRHARRGAPRRRPQDRPGRERGGHRHLPLLAHGARACAPRSGRAGRWRGRDGAVGA